MGHAAEQHAATDLRHAVNQVLKPNLAQYVLPELARGNAHPAGTDLGDLFSMSLQSATLPRSHRGHLATCFYEVSSAASRHCPQNHGQHELRGVTPPGYLRARCWELVHTKLRRCHAATSGNMSTSTCRVSCFGQRAGVDLFNLLKAWQGWCRCTAQAPGIWRCLC